MLNVTHDKEFCFDKLFPYRISMDFCVTVNCVTVRSQI